MNALPLALVDATTRLLDCANASYNVISPDMRRFACTRTGNIRVPMDEDMPLVQNLREHRPIRSLLERPRAGVLSFDQCFPGKSFFRTRLYNEYYRRSDTMHQMVFSLHHGEDASIILAANHQSNGRFDRSDRELFTLLQPHVRQIHRRLRRRSIWRCMAESMDAVHMRHGTRVIVLDKNLKPVHATLGTFPLLEKYFGRSQNALPTPVRCWLDSWAQSRHSPEKLAVSPLQDLCMRRPEGRLELRLFPGNSKLLPAVMVREFGRNLVHKQTDRFGLTEREAEVLYWIGEGKSNADIGIILGLSVRTIQKHAERIYAKLGVENRHAAATMLQSGI